MSGCFVRNEDDLIYLLTVGKEVASHPFYVENVTSHQLREIYRIILEDLSLSAFSPSRMKEKAKKVLPNHSSEEISLIIGTELTR